MNDMKGWDEMRWGAIGTIGATHPGIYQWPILFHNKTFKNLSTVIQQLQVVFDQPVGRQKVLFHQSADCKFSTPG